MFPGDANGVYEVARRGGNDILRPRHPDNGLRTAFRGTPAYAPDPRWVIRGHYRPFETPRDTTVGSVVEGLQHVYAAPGAVEFEVDGQPLALTAFNGHAAGSLHILFTDATSGVTTYAANRSLQVGAPDADGTVILDFNRATNLPCAYTEFATCPLPPAENRLPIAVDAGEQNPYEASHGPARRGGARCSPARAAAGRGEKTLVQAVGDYERQMTDYGFAAVRAAGAQPAAGVSSGLPGGWFPWWRGRAAARRASAGPRRAARPGTAR